MDNVTIPTEPANVPLPEFADPRIWLGFPSYGSKIDVGFMTSLISTLSTLPCIGDLQHFSGDSLVPRARNNLAAMFLDGRPMGVQIGDKVEHRLVKFDWLLFLDTDLIFRPEEVQMLYDLGKKYGPGVYAGTYPLKTLRPKVVFNPRNNSRVDEDGVVSVREAGTGFMLIHRQVFLKMQKAYPLNDFYTDGGDMGGGALPRHDWFQVGVKRDHQGLNPRYLSEDWFFCQKWIDMGGDILMQTKICANHIGMMVYPVNPKDIMDVAEIYRRSFEKKAERDAAEARPPGLVAAAA